MYDDIKRCLSREESYTVLCDARKYVPLTAVSAYLAALNRVKVEFRRHEPIEPKNGLCGFCGAKLESGMYCPNCGREVKKC